MKRKGAMNNALLSRLPAADETQIHARNGKIAYVMLSGGLDSTAALWWALDRYDTVKAFIVDYNQQHKTEVDYALRIAKTAGVTYESIHLDIPETTWGLRNKLTRGQACLMTALAALDIGHEGADIVHGILREDDYGDCDRAFLDRIAAVLFHPEDRGAIGVATPLRAFESKADVIAFAYTAGAPIMNTWTCRSPYRNVPCGKCVQCRQRAKAFEDFAGKYGVSLEEAARWFNTYGSPYHPVCGAALPPEPAALIRAFTERGGFKRGAPALCYAAPDGTRRVASHVRALPRRGVPKGARFVNLLCVHGFMPDGARWEVCLDQNGAAAATDALPATDALLGALLNGMEV